MNEKFLYVNLAFKIYVYIFIERGGIFIKYMYSVNQNNVELYTDC